VQNANKYYNCKSPAGENAADESVVGLAANIENIAVKYLGSSGFTIKDKMNNSVTIKELCN